MEASSLHATLRARVPRSLPPWPGSRHLRAWQQEALSAVLEHDRGEFLAAATPAAGKTTFGLRVAHELLSRRRVERVVVAAPTTHIARQWAHEAAALGIQLEPNRSNAEGPEPPGRHGLTVTYQTVAAGPSGHRRAASRPTLLIADEPHHMGELAAWGVSAAQAFGSTRFRLLLSGTPFRSDSSAIPWVAYDEDGISRSDYAYTYTQALLDSVCRPITFLTYDGEMEWTSASKRRRADFATVLPRQEAARRLRTALDPDGEFIAKVLRDADTRLSEVRASGHRDAGGLVIAADREHARALAARLARICGEQPDIVTSDDPAASAKIEAFRTSRARWLVSVLMVSEGVDVPRLRVGVYATAARTELFFRQVVGRFIRRTPAPRSQMSFLLMPADPVLKGLAAAIEEERDHALDLSPQGEEREAPEERAEPGSFVPLASSAHLDDVISSTAQPGDTLQLFADPVGEALAAFGGRTTGSGVALGQGTAFEQREALRAQRAALVARLSRLTGEAHAKINSRLNSLVGASSVSGASDAQLAAANQRLEREIEKARRR